MQCASALTQVTASVDKNPVMINESLILTVVADDYLNTDAFDSSSLLKNFVVGRTSISRQNSSINGNTTQTTTWTTLLVPRSSGKFVIPAFTLKQLRTKPINIDILEKSAKAASKPQEIFITSSLSSSEVYVQELMTLTVKLHFSIELNRGSLSDPALNDANVSQIGEDKETTEIIKGIRYRTIERTYAITPQKSGSYVITSSNFDGQIVSAAQNQRRSSFFNFNETRPVQVRGDNLSITVKPIPTNVQGDWLPSELITLHQEWQPGVSNFKVGEPITRVLTLTAAGLSEEQLPELAMSVPKGLKVYPDQAQLHSRVSNNKLVSQKVQNFALVASKPGEYQLPEVSVAWWNTVTNKLQHAVIPSQKITIAKSDEWEETAPTNTNRELTPSSISPVTGHLAPAKTPWLQWLFMGLWLATSLAWYLSARKMKTSLVRDKSPKSPSPANINLKLSNKELENKLLKACKKHHGESVLALIIPWVSQKNSNVMTLDDAIAYINDADFTNALLSLQACYFGKSPQAWNGDNLLEVLKKLNKSSDSELSESFTLNP